MDILRIPGDFNGSMQQYRRLVKKNIKIKISRADCDAPCFEQLKATHLRASPKQQALFDVLLQLIKTWPLTIGPCLLLNGKIWDFGIPKNGKITIPFKFFI